MKVYLDDIREAPDGWTRTKTVTETIALLESGKVTDLSLDHDLSFEHYGGDYTKEQTGYDVLLWIEGQVVLNGFKPPNMYAHTGNPSAKIKMEQVIRFIKEYISD